jgi:predicted transcriptional regulator
MDRGGDHMSIVMELEPETQARLDAKARELGADPSKLAQIYVEDALRCSTDDLDLSEADWAEIISGIERGERDFEAGRYRSLDEVRSDKRKRFGV